LEAGFVLQSQCLTESFGLFNPPHRQAPKRCMQPTGARLPTYSGARLQRVPT